MNVGRDNRWCAIIMARWATLLQQSCVGLSHPDTDQAERNTRRELRKLYTKTPAAPVTDSSLALSIPRFFYPRKAQSDLKHRVAKEARARFLERKLENVPSAEKMEQLWTLLGAGKNVRLNYAEFVSAGQRAAVTIRPHFTSTVFLKFPQDQHGKIDACAFFRYVVIKIRRVQVRVPLTCYDTEGNGFLTEHDLENYVFEQLPHMRQLAGVAVEFYPYYVFTAVRKFLFFLDHMKKRRVRITDMVNSKIFEEFTSLHESVNDEQKQHKETQSWFFARSAWQVYGCYLKLDVDHNGMLSQGEFLRFNGGSLTETFVNHLFQEYRMYEAQDGEMEMDYKTFLDFILAMENKSAPESVRYLFKVLDMEHVGYLSVFTLTYFFRAVHEKMMELGHDVHAIKIEDVVRNEIFDMVKPEQPDRITIEDLIRCKCAHTVFSILIDVNGFWKYDNRESLLSDGH